MTVAAASTATDPAPDEDAAPTASPVPTVLGVGVDRWLLGLAVLPFVVAAVALVVGVGGSYIPNADPALAEMIVRDVGRHPVLVGLYSRDDWSHPGPLLYYLLAPFYWVTGRSSIGLPLGALAINAASVVGMALLARRRAGLPAMTASVLGSLLLMRTVTWQFLFDPWNCFVTTLPYGVLAFLVWSLLCRDRWMLTLAVLVTSFLAQTHVGFVALAVPLLSLGVVGLVVREVRAGAGWGRRLARPVGIAAAVGVVVWVPTVIDTLFVEPANLGRILDWFLHPDAPAHTVGDGVRVVGGQFWLWPEWATTTREIALSGESIYITEPVAPWLLVPVAVAAVSLWRRRGWGPALVGVLASLLVLGVAAVARTVGPAFGYRLTWTFVAPLVAFVVVVLAGWGWLARADAAVRRGVAGAAGAAVVVLAAVNVVTATTAGPPFPGETDAMRTIAPDVVAAVADVDGPVLITDPYLGGSWYARGLMLELEKHGIDVVVPAERADVVADHWVHDGGEVGATLIVARDVGVTSLRERPDLELIAEWSVADAAEIEDFEARLLEHRESGGALDYDLIDADHALRGQGGAMAYQVGVFLEAPEG